MKSVSFEEISWLFSHFELWNTPNELFWYENMWKTLEKQELTAFQGEQERYYVILYAICLMLIYSDFNEKAYDEPVCFDDIAYVLEDDLSTLILGQLYANQGLPLLENADKALLLLARTQLQHVIVAIKKEIGFIDLFTSLCAVHWEFHSFQENEEGKIVEEEYDPASSDDFWAAFLNERDDIFANAEISPEVFCDAYERLSSDHT